MLKAIRIEFGAGDHYIRKRFNFTTYITKLTWSHRCSNGVFWKRMTFRIQKRRWLFVTPSKSLWSHYISILIGPHDDHLCMIHLSSESAVANMSPDQIWPRCKKAHRASQPRGSYTLATSSTNLSEANCGTRRVKNHIQVIQSSSWSVTLTQRNGLHPESPFNPKTWGRNSSHKKIKNPTCRKGGNMIAMLESPKDESFSLISRVSSFSRC